jgi:hypothetical protein
MVAAKAAVAKTKEQRNRLQTHPEAQRATPLPRVLAEKNLRVEIPLPRVPKSIAADCHVVQIVESPTVQQPGEQVPVAHLQSRTLRVDAQSSVRWPNYISQDEDDDPTSERHTTRSQSIMQEAVLLCVDI